MWKVKENVVQPNDNLCNAIEKQTTYRTSSSQRSVRVTQCLFETSLSVDVPVFLLNLWVSHYRDAAHALNKLTELLSRNEASATPYVDSHKSLDRKIKDFECIFTYYLNATRPLRNNPSKLIYIIK